jgi:hypothetical protein
MSLSAGHEVAGVVDVAIPGVSIALLGCGMLTVLLAIPSMFSPRKMMTLFLPLSLPTDDDEKGMVQLTLLHYVTMGSSSAQYGGLMVAAAWACPCAPVVGAPHSLPTQAPPPETCAILTLSSCAPPCVPHSPFHNGPAGSPGYRHHPCFLWTRCEDGRLRKARLLSALPPHSNGGRARLRPGCGKNFGHVPRVKGDHGRKQQGQVYQYATHCLHTPHYSRVPCAHEPTRDVLSSVGSRRLL